MTNIRMYLRCKGCGKKMLIGEKVSDDCFRFSSIFMDAKTAERKGRALSTFLMDHNHAFSPPSSPFDLVYENTPNKNV